ncbi:acyl carrier protein [Burkholderiaceae bacterium DAT-1]|nr:acyl carrier protein [Burkholderiaceae bacterium DAT-1]
MEAVQNTVNELLTDIGGKRKTIAPGKLLVEDLGFDSLKMVELMLAIEDRFDVAIPVADATRIQTVADLYQAVSRLAADVVPA